MEEVDRVRVSRVLAADAQLQAAVGLASQPRADAHKLTDSQGVERLERRALEDRALDVPRQDAALDVVAREAERRLGEVVGAEREEVGLMRDVVGAQAGT